jgi:ariadne-1
MEVKCSAFCDENLVRFLLGQKYPDMAKRFDRFLLESYIEDNASVKWCPSTPNCGHAIRVGTGERYCEVECPCGLSFCFNCMAHAHSPCPCSIWEKWNAKRSEGENIKWILANTKSCPKCFKAIEKNGGCNLVRCKCGQCMWYVVGNLTLEALLVGRAPSGRACLEALSVKTCETQQPGMPMGARWGRLLTFFKLGC